MKLVTFSTEGQHPRPGVLIDQGVLDLLALDPSLPRSVRSILCEGLLGRVSEMAATLQSQARSNYVLHAPIPDPEKIICIGLNYRNHAKESGMEIPAEPIVFSKYPSSVIGPEEVIELPSVSEEIDFEAELVVVVGRKAKNVTSTEAMDYVGGYTIGNDVSARDWQLRKPGGQWLLGKTFDTFAPIGPTLITKDEVAHPENLRISFRLNGQVMQQSTTSELIFGISQLIEYLSQVFTLEPGDLIFTGTPPGVGFARKPPVYLKKGDCCEVEIQGLGVLRNHCK